MTVYARLNNPLSIGGIFTEYVELVEGDTPTNDLLDLTNISPIPSIGWGYSKGNILPPDTLISTKLTTKLTRIKFKQRMTATERIAIRSFAASADPYAPTVFDFMDLLSEATFIDLSLPETIGGVQFLETIGLLAAGRATEILDTPITNEEAYTL